MSFGEKIKDLRLNKRLSQTEVAEMLQPYLKEYDLKKGTISNWESKSTLPSMDVLDAYAKAFGVKKSDLLELNTDAKGTSVEFSGETVEFYKGMLETMKRAMDTLTKQLNEKDVELQECKRSKSK